ncbi:hypothetical protein QBC38DRAFT_454711 [Podospora fimiseda]|uniref:Uncharacterized protein n=1 Tax=Podospora fimiseda TaxID=252190 RepID=A0AAN7BR62_9PEZI|nr:hypothetical protein QBC38DRAFT_454711 [Podospora fimiseda]
MGLASPTLSRPPLSPLSRRTATWVSQVQHLSVHHPNSDETVMTFNNDADDEDEGESGDENFNVNMDPHKHITNGNGEDDEETEAVITDKVNSQIRIYDDQENIEQDLEEDEDEGDQSEQPIYFDEEDPYSDEDDDHEEENNSDKSKSMSLTKPYQHYDSDKENEPPDPSSFPQSPPQYDSRDILIERISHLLSRLPSTSSSTEEEILSALHSKVDEMEHLLETGTIPSPPSASSSSQNTTTKPTYEQPQQRFESTIPQSFESIPPQSFESMPDTLSPSASRYYQLKGSFPLPVSPASPFPEQPEESDTTSHLTEATNLALEAAKQACQTQSLLTAQITFEAEALRTELVRITANLRTRKEESDHLHSLLVERAEAAAQRIINLESEIQELEEDITSDLRHLRIEMRALETLVSEFIPPQNSDPELIQAIANWKSDWARVKQRVTSRRTTNHLLHVVPRIQVTDASNPSSFSSSARQPPPPPPPPPPREREDGSLLGLASSPILSSVGSRASGGSGSGSNTLITSNAGGVGNLEGGPPSSVGSSSNGRGRRGERERGSGFGVVGSRK